MPTETNSTPILIAYDGSDLAQFAIQRAGEELAKDREALVLCVWQPGDVGFIPVGERELQAAAADEVKQAAEETAAHGASLAREAGFQARGLAVEAAPIWKGIVETAEAESASVIVFGSHRRKGLVGHLLGSVTAATLAHFPRSVLVVQQPS
jgi:nucleotide-binding universal stress UspA family protein